MENYDNIKTLVTQNLPDNSLQQITASKLRDVLNNLIDTIDAFDSQETTDIADLKKKASDANTSLANLRTDLTTERNRNNSQDARLTDLEGADQQIRGSIADLKKDVDENYNFTRVFFNEYAPKVKKNAEDIAALLDKIDNYEGITDANAQQIEQLLTSISKLTSDINKMNDALSNTVTKAELRQVNEHLAGLDNTDEIHQRQIDEIRDNYLGELNNRTTILEGSVDGLTNELNSLKEKVNTVETDLNDLKTNTNRKNAEQDTAINDLKAADAQIRGAIQQNEENNQGEHNWFQVQIDQHYAEANETKRQFDEVRDALAKEQLQQNTRLDAVENKNAEQDKRINELREDIDKNQNATNIGFQTQIDELRRQHEALDGDYSSFRDTVTAEQVQQNEKINKIDTELDNLAEAKNKKDAEHDKAISDLQNTDVRISDEMKKMGEILDYLQIKIQDCCAGGGSSDFFNGQGRLDFPYNSIGMDENGTIKAPLFTRKGFEAYSKFGYKQIMIPMNLTVDSLDDPGKALCIDCYDSINYKRFYSEIGKPLIGEFDYHHIPTIYNFESEEDYSSGFVYKQPTFTWANGDALCSVDEIIDLAKEFDLTINPWIYCDNTYLGLEYKDNYKNLIEYVVNKCKEKGVEIYCLFTNYFDLDEDYDIRQIWDGHISYIITTFGKSAGGTDPWKSTDELVEYCVKLRERCGGKMAATILHYTLNRGENDFGPIPEGTNRLEDIIIRLKSKRFVVGFNALDISVEGIQQPGTYYTLRQADFILGNIAMNFEVMKEPVKTDILSWEWNDNDPDERGGANWTIPDNYTEIYHEGKSEPKTMAPLGGNWFQETSGKYKNAIITFEGDRKSGCVFTTDFNYEYYDHDEGRLMNQKNVLYYCDTEYRTHVNIDSNPYYLKLSMPVYDQDGITFGIESFTGVSFRKFRITIDYFD